MQWKIDFGERDWHPWFAWHPVRLSFSDSDTRVWWEWIERRKQNVMGWIIRDYRLPEPMAGRED